MSLVLTVDDGLVVALKPAGLPSTGRTLDDSDCLQAHLRVHLGRRKLWAIHQLDRGTSGLNLFCTRKALVAAWAERLRAGEKTYLALVHGAVRGAPFDVERPCGRRRRADGREVPAITRDGKPARTTVHPRTVSLDGAFSLVEARPHTGRTHQVRLHLASLGHPLVGESLHRAPPCERLPWPALHCWRMDLGADARWEAPIPPDLNAAMAALGVSPD